MAKSGYSVKVWSQDEKKSKDTQQLEKISAVSRMIPGNAKLTEILQRKALEFADLNPDEINDIIRLENEKRDAMANMPPGMMPMAQPVAQPPVTGNAPASIVLIWTSINYSKRRDSNSNN